MVRKLYRQGDVILEKVMDLSNNNIEMLRCEKVSDRLEIVSEIGHRHLLEAEVYRGYRTYVVVRKQAMMMHDQHPPVVVEPGIYELRFVRDWLLDARPID
ncbi:MAG: hypothetical protein QXT53_04585 [Ignisphaera sp.]